MKEDVVKNLAAQVSSISDGKSVEVALCNVSENGDEALIEIIKQTDPSTVAKLLCEHDSSKISIAHFAMDADVLIKALKHFPALIQAGRDPEDISRMWCGALIGALEGLEENQRESFYNLIYEDDFAREILMYAMAGKSSEFFELQKVAYQYCPAADILLDDMMSTYDHLDQSEWLNQIISQSKGDVIKTIDVTEEIFESL